MDKDIPHLCVTRSIINDSCKLTSHSLQFRSRDDSPLLRPLFFSSLPRGLEGMEWEYGRLMCGRTVLEEQRLRHRLLTGNSLQDGHLLICVQTLKQG